MHLLLWNQCYLKSENFCIYLLMALIHFVWIVLIHFPFPFPFLICKKCVFSLYCLITWSFPFQILTSYIIFILSSAFFIFWNTCVSLLKFTAFVLAYKIVAFFLLFSLLHVECLVMLIATVQICFLPHHCI